MAYYTPNQTNIYFRGEFVASQPYPLSDWKTNPKKYYAEYQTGMIGTEYIYEYPIEDHGEMREMTVEEQLTSGKRKLMPGEKYDPITKTIYTIPIPPYLLKPVLNETGDAYIEGATQEELQDYVSDKVYSWKRNVLDAGFNYTRTKDGKKYHQTLRDKDMAKINEMKTYLEQMEAMGRKGKTIRWQFDRDNIVRMDLADMTELSNHAGMFTEAAFDTVFEWSEKEQYDLKVDTYDNYVADVNKAYEALVAELA